MKRIGRGALNRLGDIVQIVPDLEPPAASYTTRDIILSAERHVLIKEIWGEEILADRDKVMAILRAQDQIAEQTGHALRAYINMGRSLIDVRTRLSAAEFQRGLRHSKRAWRGLSHGNIEKLMAVARWWDEGILPHDKASPHYTVLYEFTTLGREAFQHALDVGIFRPDVTRNEVIGFKKRLQERGQAMPPPMPARDVEETEYYRLLVRRRQLLGELLLIRRQMLRLRG